MSKRVKFLLLAIVLAVAAYIVLSPSRLGRVSCEVCMALVDTCSQLALRLAAASSAARIAARRTRVSLLYSRTASGPPPGRPAGSSNQGRSA